MWLPTYTKSTNLILHTHLCMCVCVWIETLGKQCNANKNTIICPLLKGATLKLVRLYDKCARVCNFRCRIRRVGPHRCQTQCVWLLLPTWMIVTAAAAWSWCRNWRGVHVQHCTMWHATHSYVHMCGNVNYIIVAADRRMQRHDGEHLAVHVRQISAQSRQH